MVWVYYLDKLIQNQLRKARREAVVQRKIFDMFASRLPEEQVQAWVRQVEEYEDDRTRPDPYYREVSGASFSNAPTCHGTDR